MSADSPSFDLNRIAREFQAVLMRYAALQGQAKELMGRQTELKKTISLAKARIDLAPQATEVFDFLQERAHARSVGEFEDLLSAFVADVIPEAGRIRLEPGTERGAPALNIHLDNGGDLEDILEGNGGGLTNVVVTGLVYAAQARTNNRPLVVLDEPDCWVKASRVPAFTKVIADVANPREQEDGTFVPGCQTLMISHNDLSLMAEGAHIHQVEQETNLAEYAARLGVAIEYKGEASDRKHVVWVQTGKGRSGGHLEVRYLPGAASEEEDSLSKGFPYVESVDGARPWLDKSQVGVRWVEVANLRRHVKTRIELSSGLNVLAGDINGGKSTLFVTAFRAMAYGESDDTMIRHGADSAIIRMGLEDDVVIEMVRNRTGSPKVVYRLYVAGKLEHEGRQEMRGSAPEFITSVLKIERVDGLDIQLRSQKQPVFLLNETPARRAQLLSVGKEAGLLQNLIERQRTELRRDREALKREEVEYNAVSCKLRALAPLAGMATITSILEELQKDSFANVERAAKLKDLIGRMQPLVDTAALGSASEAILTTQLEVPKIFDTQKLSATIEQLAKLSSIARLDGNVAAPAVPQLQETLSLKKTIADLESTSLVAQAQGLLPSGPALVSLKDVSGLTGQLTKLLEHEAALSKLVKEQKDLDVEANQAAQALTELRGSLKTCPVCDQPFGEHEHAI